MSFNVSQSTTVLEAINSAERALNKTQSINKLIDALLPTFQDEVVSVNMDDKKLFKDLIKLGGDVKDINTKTNITHADIDLLIRYKNKFLDLVKGKYNAIGTETLSINIENALSRITKVDEQKAHAIINKITELSNIANAAQKNFLTNLTDQLRSRVTKYKNGIFYSLAIATVALLSLLRPAKDQNYT